MIAEATYTVTDPPLQALRRILPPLTIGSVRLDLAFLVLVLLLDPDVRPRPHLT